MGTNESEYHGRRYVRLEHCGCKVQNPGPDAADGALVKGFQDSKDNSKL